MTDSGLYVHIPFCVRKCAYCDFYSLAHPDTAQGAEAAYLDALEIELSNLPEDFHPTTVFFGGGTPTELSPYGLSRLLDLVAAAVDLDQVVEWTVEANPGTLTAEKAGRLHQAGVQRVSVGVQSFQDRHLRLLGRIHSAAEARASIALLRRTGFRNLNLDLIFGVPGSSAMDVREDLDQLLDVAPSHVSCYGLTFESGTPLTQQRNRGLIRETSDEEAARQYERICSRLTAAGYEHYEISNFCRPGYRCRHNLLYWSGGSYIGCGPAAHSHWNGVRWANRPDLAAYCTAMREGASTRAFTESLEPEAKARETLVMALRRTEGISHQAFRRQTGYDGRTLAGPILSQLIADGLLQDDEHGLRLTRRGYFVSDAIFAEMV